MIQNTIEEPKPRRGFVVLTVIIIQHINAYVNYKFITESKKIITKRLQKQIGDQNNAKI